MRMNVQDIILEAATVVLPQRVLSQDVGDELVLLDIEKGGYYGLNEVGSRIWALLQQGHPMGKIFSMLLKDYDVSEEQLRSDVQQFLLQLQAEGLIEVHEK